MRSAVHVVRMRETRGIFKIDSGTQKGKKNCLINRSLDCRLLLKWIIRKQLGVGQSHCLSFRISDSLLWTRYWALGFVNGREFLDHMSNYWRLKDDSAAWNRAMGQAVIRYRSPGLDPKQYCVGFVVELRQVLLTAGRPTCASHFYLSISVP
jgi:hypothetical protein